MKTKIFRTCVTKILALLLAVCLAAGFTPFTVGASEKTGQVGICFEDVKESDWYYEAVNYVSSRGIMTGMSEKIFGPVLELKRAHFATLIYRMEGSPDVAYKEKFADVPQGEFYSDAVIWANENGIINGYDDTGLFEPGRNISREELAVMLYRYANCRGLDTSNNEDLSAFPDKGKVNIYAKDAIAWAVEKGVITGDKGKLNPQGKANRAECAAMIQRFFGLLEKNITMPEEGERNFLEQYEKDGTLYGMKDLYSENFSIGVALEPRTLNGEKERALVQEQFSSITCENAMKPAALLNHEKTLQRGEEEYPVIDASGSEPLLTFAKENGMKVRAHTLVWYQQTPRWLFTEGFSDSADAPLVSREIMLKRMENYICQVTTYFNQNYPGLITGWDVVNEAIDSNSQEENHMFSEGNYWYEIIGADYVEKAFTYARKYADPAQNLFYNDFNCYEKEESICKMIEGLQEKGLIDGIGMQSHVLLGYPSIQNYENAIRIFADMGLEIQITELDVRQSDNSIEGQRELAVRYKEIFRTLKRLDDEGIANITNVTLWGLDDSRTWLNNDGNIHYPLLFDEKLNPKPAFFGAILDDSI